jgi:hypothetical protein
MEQEVGETGVTWVPVFALVAESAPKEEDVPIMRPLNMNGYPIY